MGIAVAPVSLLVKTTIAGSFFVMWTLATFTVVDDSRSVPTGSFVQTSRLVSLRDADFASLCTA